MAQRNKKQGASSVSGRSNNWQMGVVLTMGVGLGAVGSTGLLWNRLESESVQTTQSSGSTENRYRAIAWEQPPEQQKLEPATTRAKTSAKASTPTGTNQASQALPPKLKPKYTFYDQLPSYEVDVNATAHAMREETRRDPKARYVLQAGAFADFADADRRKAKLALLGVESRILLSEGNHGTIYRVRIGPNGSVRALNAVRNRLRRHKIEVMMMRSEG